MNQSPLPTRDNKVHFQTCGSEQSKFLPQGGEDNLPATLTKDDFEELISRQHQNCSDQGGSNPFVIDFEAMPDLNIERARLMQDKEAKENEPAVQQSIQARIEDLVQSNYYSVDKFSFRHPDTIEQRSHFVKYKSAIYLVQARVEEAEPAAHSSIYIYKLQPKASISSSFDTTSEVAEIFKEIRRDMEPQKFISFRQNGKYLYLPKVVDPTDGTAPTFQVVVDAFNLETEKLEPKIKIQDLKRRDGLKKVNSAAFLGNAYDKEKIFYNEEVSHSKFFEHDNEFMGFLSWEEQLASTMSRRSLKPAKDEEEEMMGEEDDSDEEEMMGEQEDSSSGIQTVKVVKPSTCGISVRRLGNLNKEPMFIGGMQFKNSGLLSLVNNHLLHDKFSLQGHDQLIVLMDDKQQYCLKKNFRTSKFSLDTTLDHKFISEIVTSVTDQCLVLLVNTSDDEAERHFISPKLMARIMDRHHDLSFEVNNIFEHKPLQLIRDKNIMFFDPTQLYFSNEKLRKIDHGITILTQRTEREVVQQPSNEGPYDDIDEPLLESMQLNLNKKISNLNQGLGGIELNVLGTIDSIGKSTSVQNVLLAQSQDQTYQKITPKVELAEFKTGAPTVFLKVQKDPHLPKQIHAFFNGGPATFVSFDSFSKRTVIGRKDRIQLAVSTPVYKVVGKGGMLLKYMQKHQVCIYGEDTRMFEIREFQVSWDLKSNGQVSTLRINLIGIKTLIHSCQDKDKEVLDFFAFTPLLSKKSVVDGTSLMAQFKGNDGMQIKLRNIKMFPQSSILSESVNGFSFYRDYKFFYAQVYLSKFVIADHFGLSIPPIFTQSEREQLVFEQLKLLWNAMPSDLFQFLFEFPLVQIEAFLKEEFNIFMPIPFLEYGSMASMCDHQKFEAVLGTKLKEFFSIFQSDDQFNSLLKWVRSEKTVKNNIEVILQGDIYDERIISLYSLGLIHSKFEMMMNLYHKGPLQYSIQRDLSVLTDQILHYYFSFGQSKQHYNLMMKALPLILKRDELPDTHFLEFIEDTEIDVLDEQVAISSPLNIEAPIESERLRNLIGTKLRVNQLRVNDGFYRPQTAQLLESEFARRESGEALEFKINHTIIDWRSVKLQEKVDFFQERKPNDLLEVAFRLDKMTEMNSKELAQFNTKILRKNLGRISSYKVIRNLINDQFQQVTQKFFTVLFVFFMALYFVPFLLQLFSTNKAVVLTCNSLCIFVQVALFLLEIIQIHEQKWKYFLEVWNVVDVTMFLGSIYYFIIRLRNPEEAQIPGSSTEASPSFGMILLNIFLLFEAFMKLMFFMRINEASGQLVQLISTCLYDMKTFTGFFIIWVLYFSIHFQLLWVEFDNEEYPSLPKFIVFLLQTYRNSIGDIGMPFYEDLDRIDDGWEQTGYLFIVWMSWFLNQFFVLIILLNFLIAIISQSYEQVMSEQDLHKYKHRSQLNLECFQILETFMKLDGFDHLMIWSSPLSSITEKQEWQGLVASLKTHVSKQVGKLKDSLMKHTDMIKKNSVKVIIDVDKLKDKTVKEISSMKSDISEIKAALIDLKEEMTKATPGGLAPQELRENVTYGDMAKEILDLKDLVAKMGSRSQLPVLEPHDNLSRADSKKSVPHRNLLYPETLTKQSSEKQMDAMEGTDEDENAYKME